MSTPDAILTWKASTSDTATGYQVTWTCGAINKVALHPATDTWASFITDVGYTPIHGNVISASIVAADALGQTSTRIIPTPASVTIPTPPPPAPPSTVVLVVGSPPVPPPPPPPPTPTPTPDPTPAA